VEVVAVAVAVSVFSVRVVMMEVVVIATKLLPSF